MGKKLIIVIIGLLLIGGGIYFYTTSKNKNVVLPNSDEVCTGGGCKLSDDVVFGYEVGNTIPNLKLTDFNKKEVYLYDLLKGKDKFILDLSVNWCGDCTRQNAKLQQYYGALPNNLGVAVVYLSFSKPGVATKQANETLAREKIAEQGYTFPTYYDYNDELLKAVKPTKVPVNFVLNAKGEIKAHAQEVDLDILLQDNLKTFNPIITNQ